jgi:formate C-acetyltransferase
MDTKTNPAASAQAQAWRGFEPGAWATRVNVRDFIQRNYTPYEGDGSFLAGATERTKKVWATLTPLLLEESQKGVLAVSHEPSTITAHAPGYIDRNLELIVGLQTDAPLKRAIMPKGGWRVVEDSLTGYDLAHDENVKKIFTKYAKTHNDGVFDAYTPAMRAARASGIVTGLPDAYGRGRIIGDYRRLALYGLDFLIEDRRQRRAEIDKKFSFDEVIRLREEMAEQMRSLEGIREMAQAYGYDVSQPATNAREAVQWTYFAYLAAIKEQNGAAMSVGRISTFLDIYIERDLKEGTITEWFVTTGDSVELGQKIYAVETEKTTFEVESPFAGTITVLGVIGEVTPIGTPIAEIIA